VLADVGSIPTASTSIQKQSPAGASRWGFVFEYPHEQMEIESTSGTDVGRSRGFSPQRGEPAQRPCAGKRKGSPIRPIKQSRSDCAVALSEASTCY
jgi:hypothetical protein